MCFFRHKPKPKPPPAEEPPVLISGTLASPIGGVSQQPAAQRLASQSEVQVNWLDSVSAGKTRRPRINPRLEYAGMDVDEAHFVPIDLGEKGQFILTFDKTSGTVVLKAYMTSGGTGTITVNNGSGASAYLNNGSPEIGPESYRVVVVDDYALILNRNQVVGTTSSGAASDTNQFLIQVRAGNYSTTYRVEVVVNGVVYTLDKTTSTSDPNDIKTTKIATDLVTLINATAAITAEFNVYRRESTIWLKRKVASVAAVGVRVSDSRSNADMVVVKDTVQRFSDLPTTAASTFNVIKVIGENGSLANPYYVSFSPTGVADSNGMVEGVWVETVTNETRNVLNAQTLPYKLTYDTGTGQFTLAPAVWSDRTVGDSVSSPDPSFVGNQIKDLVIHRNRLGLLTDAGVILSVHGKPFTFYRATVTALLDTDPIDLKVSHPKAAGLRNAVVYQNSLIVFSKEAQFVLTADGTLTPANAGVDLLSEYPTLDTPPVIAGRSLFAAFQRGQNYLGIWEFTGLADDLQGDIRANADDITKHVPRYIPGQSDERPPQLVADAASGTLVVLSPQSAPRSLFVYRYFWAGDEKLVSSWSIFTNSALTAEYPSAGQGGTFGSVYMLDGRLHVSVAPVEYSGSTPALQLGTIDFSEADGPEDIANPAIHGDFLSGIAGTYDAGTGLTTWNVTDRQWDSLAFWVSLVGSNMPNGTVRGQLITTSRVSATSVTASGNWTNTGGGAVVCGQPFRSRWVLSRIYPKFGEAAAELSGRLQLQKMIADLQFSGTLTATVDPADSARASFDKSFTPTATNPAVDETATFSWPIMTRSDAEITLTATGAYGVRVQSIQWTGLYYGKHQRVQ